MSQTPIMATLGVTKRFPGVLALDRVDFSVLPGEIHALMGQNGAGKSTLIKVLTGLYPPDGGQILLGGKQIHCKTPSQAQAAGISTVYQEVNLVAQLSVAENLYLGRQPTLLGLKIRWRRMHEKADAAMRRLEINIDVRRPLGEYSLAVQQMVAIARALDGSPRVLILDEPTSSLDARETASLFDVMRRLKSERMGIVFVTHFLDQVYQVSDRITILRNGKLAAVGVTAEMPRLALVSEMIGRDASKLMEHPPARQRTAIATQDVPLLRARGLARSGVLAPFDMEARGGEVVGLAGLLGSGRSECARLLFGADRADRGHVEFNGKTVRLRQPRNAIAQGVGYCGEDRKTDGIIPDLSVRENIILAMQGRRGWLRRISRRRQLAIADRFIAALNIATNGSGMPIKLLSGGNQQKVLLARWLATEPKLLILDEPTRGIDVGAKFEIAALIEDLCQKGMALIFISSELDEAARLSHRVVVLRDRKIIGTLSGDQVTERNIMATIAGEAAHA